VTNDEKLDDVLRELSEIKALLSAKLVGLAPPSLALSREEAMSMLGFTKSPAFYKWTARNKVRPFRRGYYRRQDLVEAIARASFYRCDKKKPTLSARSA